MNSLLMTSLLIICFFFGSVISYENSFHEHVFDQVDVNLATSLPPPCITNESELAYVNGKLSSTQTFYNCMANIPDSGMLASYYNNQLNGQVTFYTAMTLNNIINVDEVSGTATFQFSFGLSWYDQRYAMPLFWAQSGTDNIDVSTVITNDSVLFFIPQLRFPDATDLSFQTTNVNLGKNNMFVQKFSVTATFIQPSLNFRRYPYDTQNFYIRYYMFPYKTKYATIKFFPPCFDVNLDVNGQPTVNSNQIWNFLGGNCSYSVPTVTSSYVVYELSFQRLGSGVVLRLIVPLLLLVLLSGLTFWAVQENRVDSTITILLSVSALYIVVLNNIPLVGYLTDVDKFVFWMFLLIFIIITIHQIYNTMIAKHDRWPLRLFYLRLLDLLGRTFVFPAVFLYFLQNVKITGSQSVYVSLIVVICTITAFIFFRELFGIRAIIKLVLTRLIEKFNNRDISMSEVGYAELFIINLWKLGRLSFSYSYIKKHLQQHGELKTGFIEKISLKEMAEIDRMLYGDSSDSDVNKSKSILGSLISMFSFLSLTRRRKSQSKDNTDDSASKSQEIQLADINPKSKNPLHTFLDKKNTQTNSSEPQFRSSVASASGSNDQNPSLRPSFRLSEIQDSDDEEEGHSHP